MKKPKNKDIEAFKSDADAVLQVNHCMAAGMLLRSVARTYEREAASILRVRKLQVGEAQAYATTADNAFNTYIHYMEGLRFDPKNDSYLQDYDKVMRIVEEHMPDILKTLIKFID